MRKSTGCGTHQTDGKNWLADLEGKEREKTGIKNLRIKYNKVFGYYLEVTNSFKDLVPDYYTRKQTLDQCRALYYAGIKRTRRYDSRCGRSNCIALEYELFRQKSADTIADKVARIQATAREVAARLDVFASLGTGGRSRIITVRPKMNE